MMVAARSEVMRLRVVGMDFFDGRTSMHPGFVNLLILGADCQTVTYVPAVLTVLIGEDCAGTARSYRTNHNRGHWLLARHTPAYC